MNLEMAVPNIVIYSNCQSKGIRFCLSSVMEANFEELINYEYIREKKDLPIEILKSADIFIYHPTDSKHGIYSTSPDGILKYLRSDCKKISFPYIYNSALWAFVPENGKYKDIEPFKKLKSEGHSLESIQNKFLNGELDFEYQKRFDNCMNILREKEKMCDVKVADFISVNIKNIKLFLTQNHPTIHVYIHCANQILELLGIDNSIKHNPEYTENMATLPGNYVHSTYDVRFWKFDFPVRCWDVGWAYKIKEVYNSIKD